MMTKSMPMPHSKTKKERDVEDFEAEMHMELNRRAMTVEIEGGVQHQKSLSRSSSTASLNTSAAAMDGTTPQPAPSSSNANPSLEKKTSKQEGGEGHLGEGKKSVRFSEKKTVESGIQKDGGKVKEMYDEIYFDSEDSGEDDTEVKAKKASSRKFQSNDDLFYDPAADDKDQVWVNKQRDAYFSKHGAESVKGGAGTESQESNKPLPSSDAVLNCPACFTLLCLDCQRHDFYEGQYRAMFVMNCATDKTENRYIPSKSGRYKGRKRKLSNGSAEAAVPPSFQPDSSDSFNPVKCKVCNTEVAVFDSDEVYHFYNVLTSHS